MRILIFTSTVENSTWNSTGIHNQITLALKDATIDEILPRQREMPTDFGYRASIGFSYYFGSIYNYIINPRFGD